MSKNKKPKPPKPIRYRDFPSSYVKVPQPKGKFVDLFKVMQERNAEGPATDAARARHQGHTSE